MSNNYARPEPKQTLAQIVAMFGTGNATNFMVSLIEEGLAKENEQGQQARLEERGTLDKLNPHVTDIGKCPRKVVKSLLNHPETNPLTTDSLINFGVGHAIEEWFAHVMELQGALAVREIKIRIPYEGEGMSEITSGRTDFFLAWPEESILCELKSTSSRAMHWMLKRGENGKEDHRYQLNQYLDASQKQCLSFPDPYDSTGILEPSFDKGFLVYVVKDAVKGEPNIHAWEVPYDKELAEHHQWELAKLADMARAGNVPDIPADYDPKKFPCSYCSFQGDCWGERYMPKGVTL